MAHRLIIGLVGSLAFIDSVLGQSCKTTTLRTTVPPSGQHVAVQSYSYCGGTLNVTSYISNDDYNKIVELYFANSQGQSTPLTSVQLNYLSSVPNTNWELWGAVTPVYYDGITKLLNITYQATDIGKTFNQILNKAVTASGPPAPTIPSPPAPYATPKNFGDDITNYLAAASNSQAGISLAGMFKNINPAIQGAAPGVVVAARSGPSYPQTDPNYEYTWVRDTSLTMDVVQKFYAAATKAKPKMQYQNTLFQYAAARATQQNDPNLQTGLGEPKFYLNDTIFSGPWGRPQNDGPATASITLINFANSYIAAGGSLQTVKQKIYDSTNYPKVAPVQKDLLFVASNWSSPTFDIWEEEESTHFYDRLVSRRALILGIQLAKLMNDTTTAAKLSTAEQALTPTLNQFWDQGRKILLYEYGPVLHGKYTYLDNAVILGVIHGYSGDNVYGFTNDQVLSTTVRLATSFLNVYPLANQTQKTSAGVLGIPNGRYPEDVYNGTGTQTNGGNPWFLCTSALAQLMWAASADFSAAKQITVSNTSVDFFNYFAPDSGVKSGQTYAKSSSQFAAVIASLNGWGDAFMRTVKYYTPSGGHLPEEFNRNTGAAQGAGDLTWSYAALITAALQRATTRGQPAYAANLANLGFTPNGPPGYGS